jgi:hypothetical protein
MMKRLILFCVLVAIKSLMAAEYFVSPVGDISKRSFGDNHAFSVPLISKPCTTIDILDFTFQFRPIFQGQWYLL